MLSASVDSDSWYHKSITLFRSLWTTTGELQCCRRGGRMMFIQTEERKRESEEEVENEKFKLKTAKQANESFSHLAPNRWWLWRLRNSFNLTRGLFYIKLTSSLFRTRLLFVCLLGLSRMMLLIFTEKELESLRVDANAKWIIFLGKHKTDLFCAEKNEKITQRPKASFFSFTVIISHSHQLLFWGRFWNFLDTIVRFLTLKIQHESLELSANAPVQRAQLFLLRPKHFFNYVRIGEDELQRRENHMRNSATPREMQSRFMLFFLANLIIFL